MEQTVIQIGNSLGIIIPSKLRSKAKLKKGSTVFVDVKSDSREIVITRGIHTSMNQEFLEVLESVNKRYGKALQELADK